MANGDTSNNIVFQFARVRVLRKERIEDWSTCVPSRKYARNTSLWRVKNVFNWAIYSPADSRCPGDSAYSLRVMMFSSKKIHFRREFTPFFKRSPPGQNRFMKELKQSFSTYSGHPLIRKSSRKRFFGPIGRSYKTAKVLLASLFVPPVPRKTV